MKRFFIAAMAGVAALALVGCAKDEQTLQAPEGTVTTSTDTTGESTVKVSGKNGSAEMTTSKDGAVTFSTTDAEGKTASVSAGTDFDLAELGIELYPGSEGVKGSESQSKIDTDKETTFTVARTTSDPVAKVAAHFKGQLHASSDYTSADVAMLEGKNPKGETVTVAIAKDAESGKTQYTVTVLRKKK